MILSFGVVAQSDDSPTSETEIICYAAQKQWVCAPADQKEKAHDKAMKLVQQGPDESDDEALSNVGSGQVEIQPLADNNINEPVNENPLAASIRDFIPRDDANNADTPNVEPEPVQNDTPTTVQAEQPTQVANQPDPDQQPTQVANQPDPVHQPSGVQSSISQTNDFGDWQMNHPNQWSFQVVGTSNRHHLDQFIIDKKLNQNNFAIVKTQVNGADWWVVLSGLYDSREQALSQRYELPSDLAGNAWVRQVKSIVGVPDP